MALTGKKQKFADAVLAGLSNKAAAVKAGYSQATASQCGSRLAKDPDVVTYIGKRRKEAGKASGKKTKAAPEQAPVPQIVTETDPLKFLEGVMTGRIDANITQVRAATSMLPFVHQKLGEGGKKEKKAEAAKKIAGRFAAAAPPKLVAAGGKKV